MVGDRYGRQVGKRTAQPVDVWWFDGTVASVQSALNQYPQLRYRDEPEGCYLIAFNPHSIKVINPRNYLVVNSRGVLFEMSPSLLEKEFFQD